mmetsp:Transcript_6840/g.12532  ORF Transcript_6840/g.12532 Transcript_6840/m.12532 type:complete len:143 (-) Transcript_6840:195-623(-)|eukprot:CAMPEP_0197516256 /NCGR_PEP_ID=MMETSP1318-20131121/1104_1 /TAXON_ID=552666 /ORGANISM="Partenskyella glossopodia, Strain RCC365" /LENGTH=142 /DNA_ID=CAMNT_0043064827 /DNA_START=29 /DNA_END=457 /DNA_ORIENTATION=+
MGCAGSRGNMVAASELNPEFKVTVYLKYGTEAQFEMKAVGVNRKDKLITVCGTAVAEKQRDWQYASAETPEELEGILANFIPIWAYRKDTEGTIKPLADLNDNVGDLIHGGYTIVYCGRGITEVIEDNVKAPAPQSSLVCQN